VPPRGVLAHRKYSLSWSYPSIRDAFDLRAKSRLGDGETLRGSRFAVAPTFLAIFLARSPVRAGDASRPTTGARATGVPSRRSPLPPPPYGSSARGSVKTYTAAAAAARGLSLDRREEMVERDAGARAEGAPVKRGGGRGEDNFGAVAE